MGANVLEGAQDVSRHWRRGGQVITHRVEALLVGGVAQRDVLALGRNIGNGTTRPIGIAGLLVLDAIAGLIGELVIALRVAGLVLEAPDLGVLVDIVGAGAADQSQAEQL